MDSSSKKYTALEIACVFCWFLLDGFWLLEWKLLTYAFSVIAVTFGAAMFMYIKHERVVVLVACADTTWLLLNILWAIGDLSKLSMALYSAKVLFLVAFLFCVAAFFASEVKSSLSSLVLSRLRILKFFERK